MSTIDQTAIVMTRMTEIVEFAIFDGPFDGESPLDRAARDVAARVDHEVVAAFGNAPRA